MKAAKGRYIYFLDSDDTIAVNLLEELMHVIKTQEVDIVGFSAVVTSFNNTCLLSTGNYTNMVERGIEISQRRVPLSTVPLYCYRRDFLKEKCLTFKEKIYYEDILFTALVFLENPKVYYMDLPLYFYNKREESITTSKAKGKNYFDIIEICKLLIKVNKVGWSVGKKTAFKNIMKSYILLSEEIYRMLDEKDKKSLLIVREDLMETVKSQRKEMGWKNYIIACFPNILFAVREVRRKIRCRNQI